MNPDTNYQFVNTFAALHEVDWLLNEEKQFVLFFRPRCGSTTLTRWFFENMGVKFGGFSIAMFRFEWLDPKLPYLKKYLDEHYEKLHKFVVIRNPIHRAVSSYLHVVNHTSDSQWSIVKPYVPYVVHKHDLTFRDWVRYLTCIDLNTSHVLWKRQSVLTCWQRGVNDIVVMEAMNNYLLNMNKRYGLIAQPTFNSVTVPEKEKKHPENCKIIKNFYGDTAFRELLSFKGKAYFQNFPYYDYFYDDGLRKVVEQLYSKDIEIFNRANIKL